MRQNHLAQYYRRSGPLFRRRFKNRRTAAKDISNYRPSCPVIAISPSSKVVRGLSINYGIIPISVGMAETTDELIELSLEAAKKVLDLSSGKKIVIVGSFPIKSVNYTNFMKIEEIK